MGLKDRPEKDCKYFLNVTCSISIVELKNKYVLHLLFIIGR